VTAPETPHGWLDSTWAEPDAAASVLGTRARRLSRTIFLISGAVMIATTVLPWNEHHRWVQFPGSTLHHYVSFESTTGLGMVWAGTLVPLVGIALIVVNLRMVPDRRSVGFTIAALAFAGVVCCAIAIGQIEAEFVRGLSRAAAWGACGGTTGISCYSVPHGPFKDACGIGVYLATAAALLCTVTGVLFAIAAWNLDGTTPER
jgi:hypothetical protein